MTTEQVRIASEVLRLAGSIGRLTGMVVARHRDYGEAGNQDAVSTLRSVEAALENLVLGKPEGAGAAVDQRPHNGRGA